MEPGDSSLFDNSLSRVRYPDVRVNLNLFNCPFTCLLSVELIFYTNIAGLIMPSIQICQSWVKFEVISGHCLAFCVDLLLAIRSKSYNLMIRQYLLILLSPRFIWTKSNNAGYLDHNFTCLSGSWDFDLGQGFARIRCRATAASPNDPCRSLCCPSSRSQFPQLPVGRPYI